MASQIPGNLGPLGDFNHQPARPAPPPKLEKALEPQDGFRRQTKPEPKFDFKDFDFNTYWDKELPKPPEAESLPKPERKLEFPKFEFKDFDFNWDKELPKPRETAPTQAEPLPLPDAPTEKTPSKSLEELLAETLKSWKKPDAKADPKAEVPKKTKLDEIWGGSTPAGKVQHTKALHTKMGLFGDLETPTPPGRYQGSWSDYTTVLEEHNKAVQAYQSEQAARRASSGDLYGGLAMMAFDRGGGPKVQAPPLLPQAEALEVWNNRHLSSLGKLMSPPIGEVSPEVKRVQTKIAEMVEKMAGDELRAKGIKLNVNIFAGDVLNAFAGRTSDDWKGDGRVTPERAKYNASLATLRPQLENPDKKGGAIYELGITAGALRKLESEDELAFLLGHELAHLLEGHVEPVGRSWMSSQSHEAVADHEGFRMMIKAGYDPAQGLRLLNRLHEGHDPPDLPDLLQGVTSGLSSHHHEGVRVALGQIKLEQMRRTDAEAQPTEVVRPLPEWMKLETDASLNHDPDGKLAGATRELAQEFLQGPVKAAYSFEKCLQPVDSKAIKLLGEAPWEPGTAGRVYQQALEELDKSPGEAQKKGDAALFLLHALSKRGFDKDGPPDLSEVKEQVTAFFQHQTEGGWKADAFLANLAAGAPSSRVDSQFALKVLLAPGFQEIDLYPQNAEWKKLVDSAPTMLATPDSQYASSPSSFSEFAAALTVLAGANPKGKSYDGTQWPKELPPGQGRLDDVHRQNLNQFLKDKATTSKWGDFHTQRMIYDSLDKAPPGPFSQQIHQSIQPIDQAVQRYQEGQVKTAFESYGNSGGLFQSAVQNPLSPEQNERLKENFLKRDYPEHLDFTNYPVLGQMLGEILDSPESTAAQKSKVANYMLDQVGSSGLGQDSGTPGHASLNRYLGEQDQSRLLQEIQSEVQARGKLGTPPPPPEPPGMRGMNLSRHEDRPKPCPTPLLSTVGYHRSLSPQLASRLPADTLNQWLGQLKTTGNRIDSGTRLFLLDGFIAHQGQHKDLDGWSEKLEDLLRGSYRFLDGRGEVREQLAGHLYPQLSEQKPDKLKDWLKEDRVQSILKTEQTAELMSRLLLMGGPGTKYDAVALGKELRALEQEFKLEDRPALKRALHEKVAEKAHLQPDQMDLVFPRDERSVSQQAKSVDKEIRGLSAMVAAARTRPPKEQLQLIEFLMGRVPEAPEFFAELDKLAGSVSGLNLSDLMEETRRSLADADQGVRTAVATSFLAGPSGMLRDPQGREMLLDHFTSPVRESNKELATSLASVLLDAHGSQDALAVGYLLAQKGKGGQALSEGEVLNSLFDAYGVPGIKLKQYLAFTSDFAEFREHFESSQDSAMPLNYYEAVRLVQHHYGKDWPKHWEVQDVIGSGSVNVAVRFLDQKTGETKVVSLPRQDVEVCSEYDFWRMGQFLDLFTKEPANQEKYGFLRGLTEVIRDSVSLEFDRGAAYKMQQSVQPFYERKVGDWTIKTVQAHSLDGKAIVMEEAKGRTARRVLGDKPDVYKSAMQAMAQVEQDALLGIATEKNPKPQDLHANPDFHDGQVLIDEATHTVTILDFGQAVAITGKDREYAIDLLTIIGKGYQPEQASQLLQKRTGAQVDEAELAKILASPDQMDVFTKMLGTMTQHGAKIPLPVVHWVLGMNRQRSLGEKLDAPIDKKLRTLAAVRMTGGSLEAYNAMRIARRSPMQALRGGILGPMGAWVEKLLTEQNPLDLIRGKVQPKTLD